MNRSIEKIEKLAAKKKGAKIMRYLGYKGQDVRIAGMEALGKCGDNEKSFNTLLNMLEDSDPDVRIAAARGLGETQKDTAFTPISHAITNEKDGRVEQAMRDALKKIRQARHDE